MRIAVADGEETIRASMLSFLREDGHECRTFHDGGALMGALLHDCYDLLFIDWTIPPANGLDILCWARETLSPCPPVIMLCRQGRKADIARALDAGADDCIAKPEARSVILSRMNAVMRRNHQPPENRSGADIFGPYRFDWRSNIVLLGGETISLTAREFALARLFFLNPDRALSRAYLLETLWHSAPDLPTRTLDMHISRIRSKLRLGLENGYRLQTIFGHGYRLEVLNSDTVAGADAA